MWGALARIGSECALRVLFAPPFASQVPHLRQANCGAKSKPSLELASRYALAKGIENGELKIPVLPVFLVFPVFLAGVTGVTGKTGEFENRLFSGRGEALRRRVADKVGAHSNLFESGLAVRLPNYLRR